MSFKIRSVYTAAIVSGLLSFAAVASAAYTASGASIEFKAKGPIGVKIDGKSANIAVTETDKTVTFATKLKDLDTGNPDRNKHMRDRFKAESYPDVELTVDKDKVEGKNGGKIPAKLKFHGVTKTVQVDYSNKDGKVKADFAIDIFEFGVKEEDVCFEPRTKSICAKKDVTIHVELNLKK